MQLSNAPSKLLLPFAEAGDKVTVPVAPGLPGLASLTEGFPELTRTPISAGGIPPSGLDMNGILYAISALSRWAGAGGSMPFDAAFAGDTNVNGYPKGARILRADGLGNWRNTVDNNTANPDSGGAGWLPDTNSGGAPVTLSNANVTLTPAQYNCPVIILSGVLTANVQVIFPAMIAEWIVINTCTGNFTVTAKTAAGAGFRIISALGIVGDGVNIRSASADAVNGANFGPGTPNGFFVFPKSLDSMIIQWSEWTNTIIGTDNAHSVVVTLPMAFPTAHFITIGSMHDSTANTNALFAYVGQSPTLTTYTQTMVAKGTVNALVSGYAISIGW